MAPFHGGTHLGAAPRSKSPTTSAAAQVGTHGLAFGSGGQHPDTTQSGIYARENHFPNYVILFLDLWGCGVVTHLNRG